MSDRRARDAAFLIGVSAVVLIVAGGGALTIAPTLPDDAIESAAGRVVQLAALGFGAAGALAGALQAVRMYRTQSANDVSRGFLGMLTASFACWLAYGVAIHDPVLQAVNVLGLASTGTTLAYAVRLQRRDR